MSTGGSESASWWPNKHPALGLPVGGDLEYADRLMIARSLRGRAPLE